nr:hypothetical protein [Tanacetum cinerariifolium]
MVQAQEEIGEESVADEAINGEMSDSLERATTTTTSSDTKQDRGVNTPESEEDILKLNELMDLCTILQNMVLALEATKTSQPQEIDSLKRRVEKLKKKQRTELVKESTKKDKAKTAQESSSKRARDELEQESSKKQKIDDDTDTTELKQLVNIISEEDIAIDAIPLISSKQTELKGFYSNQRVRLMTYAPPEPATLQEEHGQKQATSSKRAIKAKQSIKWHETRGSIAMAKELANTRLGGHDVVGKRRAATSYMKTVDDSYIESSDEAYLT